MLFGNFVKRVCTVGWTLVGLIVAAMIAQGGGSAATLGDPENAFGYACRQLLFPGALGLLIASILAASMSACSAFMIGAGALFTEGLYRPRLAPGRADRHYLWVGRVSGVRRDDDRRDLCRIPDRPRALHVSADRDAGNLCRHQRARRRRLAAREPVGRARQPVERARGEFPSVLSDRPAAGSLGSECVPRRPARRDRGAGRRQPADGARAGRADRLVLRAAADAERRRHRGRGAAAARQCAAAAPRRTRTRLADLPGRSRRAGARLRARRRPRRRDGAVVEES